MKLVADKTQVRVPGSLGGLSSFGLIHLATGPEDVLTLRAVAGSTRVSGTVEFVRQESAHDHPTIQAVAYLLERVGAPQIGVHLQVQAAIPRGAGLGAHAAQVIGGLIAARDLVDGEGELSDSELLTMSGDLGADPVRAQTSLEGGITVATLPGSADSVSRFRCRTDLELSAFVPGFTVDESRARTPRPKVIRYLQAAEASGRTARLLTFLTEASTGELSPADTDLLMELTDDSMNREILEKVSPASGALTAWLRNMNIPAFISGTGPAVVALGALSDSVVVASARSGWRHVPLNATNSGAAVVAPSDFGIDAEGTDT